MAVYAGSGAVNPGKKKFVKRPYVFGTAAGKAFLAQQRGMAQPGGGGGGNSGIVDNYLNQARADFAADSAADAASRDAALRRFIISYGEVPDFAAMGGLGKDALGFLKGAITPEIAALAAKNTAEGTSIKARMAKENEVANRRIPATLAGRGLLRSGQTGYDLGEQARQYKIQGFDTLNELLGGIEGTVGNFLNAERERQRALAQAAMEAAASAYGDWGDSYMGSSGDGMAPSVVAKMAGSRPTVRRPGPSRAFLKKQGKRYRPPARQRISGVQY